MRFFVVVVCYVLIGQCYVYELSINDAKSHGAVCVPQSSEEVVFLRWFEKDI